MSPYTSVELAGVGRGRPVRADFLADAALRGRREFKVDFLSSSFVLASTPQAKCSICGRSSHQQAASMAAVASTGGGGGGGGGVKLEVPSGAATPSGSSRRASALPPPPDVSPRPGSEAAATARAVNTTTTTAAELARHASGHSRQQLPSLFDPTHLPTLYTRIEKLSGLVVEASRDAASLTAIADWEPPPSADYDRSEAALARGAQASADPSPPVRSSSSYQGPNVALGASTDEDDATAGYETALSLSFHNTVGGSSDDKAKQTRPSALAESLVRESVGLRDAFRHAREAVQHLEGGEMDIEEQERLIATLENYVGVQRCVEWHEVFSDEGCREITHLASSNPVPALTPLFLLQPRQPDSSVLFRKEPLR